MHEGHEGNSIATKRLKANSILYFGPTVRDAESMAYLSRREGVSATVISGGTQDVTRRQMVAEFKKGNIRVSSDARQKSMRTKASGI